MKREKERLTGAGHYKDKELKPILVYVSARVHGRLIKFAHKEGSLQKLVRKILERYTANH